MDSLTTSALTTFGILCAITAFLGYVSWRMTRGKGIGLGALNLGGSSTRRVRIVERVGVDARRGLLVVQAGDRHWLLGMTEQQFNLIAELSPEDLGGPDFARLVKGEVEQTQRVPGDLGEELQRLGRVLGLGLLVAGLFLGPGAHAAHAATVPGNFNFLDSFDLRSPLATPGLTTPIQLIFVMSALTLLPFLIIMTTSFMRTIIVLSFLRQALGTQSIPPNPILIGLALFLAVYTMTPVWQTIDSQALQPYMKHQMTQAQAFTSAVRPLEEFMLRQTNEAELGFFIRLAHEPLPRTPADVPLHVAIPAFMVSELSTAFKIGFVIFLPFMVIDLLVSNILLALSMSSLPPTVISTSFKVLIFTLANGWHLIIQALVQSFR